MNRYKARKQAFLLIFQYKFQPECVDALLAEFLKENDVGEARNYIESTVLGTMEYIEELDRLIEQFSDGWTLDRISSVSLAALRIGTYEVVYSKDVPMPVAVNEAVSLAKEYEGEEAVPFVNGILGKIKDEIGKRG